MAIICRTPWLKNQNLCWPRRHRLRPFQADCGDAALVRSLAVAADVRGTGLGATVLRRALEEARGRPGGVYALTTTAEAYLARFGFEPIARAGLPVALLESRELQGACPTSAAVMRWAAR